MTQTDAVKAAKELEGIITHFVNETARFFFYYLETCAVSINGRGEPQFEYAAVNYDGDSEGVTVYLDGTTVKYEKRHSFAGLIKGCSRTPGKAIQGDENENKREYFSKAMSFLSDVERWSEKYNCPIARLVFPGFPGSRPELTSVTPSTRHEGEYVVVYRTTLPNTLEGLFG